MQTDCYIRLPQLPVLQAWIISVETAVIARVTK